MTDHIPLAKVDKVLLYRISKSKHDTFIEHYEPMIATANATKPSSLLNAVHRAVKSNSDWKPYYSFSQRVVAELILKGKTKQFDVIYYYLGPSTIGCVASFFVYDNDHERTPLFSGYLDYPHPASRSAIESFFPSLPGASSWNEWCHSSYVSKHRISPLLRLSVDEVDYICLRTEASITPYPEGYVIGGIPFGSEHVFLALANISSANSWNNVFSKYTSIFARWNLVCQSDSLQRVFIVGAPGAGKDLWYSAIQGGVRNRISLKNWKAISAALDTDQIAALLYGERDGNLERKGVLAECEGGGVFIDELGKSTEQFRNGLLRVLESQEYIPRGGEPRRFEKILFIFASTPSDKDRAFAPPDFWTRIDLEINLPEPIRLLLGKKSVFTSVDQARFYSVFAHFWFAALKERSNVFKNHENTVKIKQGFEKFIFNPLMQSLIRSCRTHLSRRRGVASLSISPRRIKMLAKTLVREYVWTGKKSRARSDPEAAKMFNTVRDALLENFVRQIHADEKNNKEQERLIKRKDKGIYGK
ncbi:MAG TPA: sigma 54-interacting transcriptional regulator [Candidatus Saccharimonadales bacterium]|nr:sigma 54-interacting transcriptional regulator [Candidatus Saccharimonadales bacterium]